MDIESLSIKLNQLTNDAKGFFIAASDTCKVDENGFNIVKWKGDIDAYWNMLEEELQNASFLLQKDTLSLVTSIISVIKGSPILNEADERDIGIITKKMRAALRLRKFRSWDTEVLHDEGTVLGVSPPGQSDDELSTPKDSRLSCLYENSLNFLTTIYVFLDLLDLAYYYLLFRLLRAGE